MLILLLNAAPPAGFTKLGNGKLLAIDIDGNGGMLDMVIYIKQWSRVWRPRLAQWEPWLARAEATAVVDAAY